MTIQDDISNWVKANPQVIADVLTALEASKQTDRTDKYRTNLAIAQKWFDDAIKPTLTLVTTDPLLTQRTQCKADFDMLIILYKAQTDSYQREVVNLELGIADGKFKEIKVSLNG